MKRMSVTIGLCVACALLGSVLVVQSASGVTRSFTCVKVKEKTGTFNDAHCTGSSDPNEYGHVDWSGRTPVFYSFGTFFGGKQVLKATINGIATELVTEGGVSGEGEVENTTIEGEEAVTGEGGFTYTKVTVAKPAGKGCKVYTDNGSEKGEEGVIHTNELVGTTTSGMGVKFTPKSGSVFASFFIDGCEGEALKGLNKTYTVQGSIIGEPNGGEIRFTHGSSTEQGSLLLNGSIKTGLEGGITQYNRVSGNALVCTTQVGGAYKEEKVS
jgi:hypothetical protein